MAPAGQMGQDGNQPPAGHAREDRANWADTRPARLIIEATIQL
jgi:hypothetical protein